MANFVYRLFTCEISYCFSAS